MRRLDIHGKAVWFVCHMTELERRLRLASYSAAAMPSGS
jgi:hypothetical protein